LSIDECIAAVESAFSHYAEGKMLPPKILGMHTENGGFHIKAGIGGSGKTYFVSKLNSNFPNNPKYGLPSIQGVIVICDGADGRLLALIDSIEITIIRTGAATAVAAKYLASVNAKNVTVCGCGNQGRISLKALMKVRDLEKVYAFDIDKEQREKFAVEFQKEIKVIPITAGELAGALDDSHICVTCTPSKEPYIHARDIRPGTFIAAVGADSEDKQELFVDLVASNKVVTDVTEQSKSIGELHHAIKSGLINMSGVHAELGEIITRKKTGRETDKEIIIFDSTGTALQDVVSAAIVYDKALVDGFGSRFNFSE
jgi:ornithine cyclodeaminase/alanine dehydrogenase-like protein (mu-crystallin family)